MRTHALLLAFVASTVSAVPVHAQTGAFAGGGASAAGMWFSNTKAVSPATYDNDTSGRTAEWFVTAGGTVARHAVLQAELTFGTNLKTDIKQSIYPPGYPYPPTGKQVQTITYRFRNAAFMGGYTTGTPRRVNASALAGVMFVQSRRTFYSLFTPPTPGPYPNYPSEDVQTTYSIAPAFGFDVLIRLASHAVLVPQVRTYKIPVGGPLSVSAGAGGRVTF